jgi:proline iminopeptidase
VICPPRNAFTLHRAWPGSVLRWVDEAGHSAAEPAVARALADATDELRPLLRVVPA